jgi:hypothetical protein
VTGNGARGKQVDHKKDQALDKGNRKMPESMSSLITDSDAPQGKAL